MVGKEIEKGGHVIVCGYGLVGQTVASVLAEHGIGFIMIDADSEAIEKAKAHGYSTILGDATLSKTMKSANIIGARAIVIVMDNDAKNLFAVLTARDLNKRIFIATRANDDFVREKLIEAGADYIVMPQKEASKEIAKELLKQ